MLCIYKNELLPRQKALKDPGVMTTISAYQHGPLFITKLRKVPAATIHPGYHPAFMAGALAGR